MQLIRKKLKNNLETLFIDSPGSTFASVQIWFRAGSANEDRSNHGIAHFLEHMFFKGTKARPEGKIAHEVESFGGEINAFTSFDYTCYYINTPISHLNKTVEIIMDMVANPRFLEKDLIPEREVVYEEYRRALDNPTQYSFSQIQKNFFTKGYSHMILGGQKTIKSFTRKQLNEFRRQFYNCSNAMLIVAGDLTGRMKKTVSTIEGLRLPQGKEVNFSNFVLRKGGGIEIHQKDVRMSQLTMIIQGPHYDGHTSAAEDLMINCFGHGESSRLYRNLVIKNNLANNSSGTTMYMSKGGAHFMKVVFPHKNLNRVLTRLLETLEEVMLNGLEKWELQKIKNQYVASKVYEQESLESYAFSLGHGFAQTGNINCESEFIEKIKMTSLKALNNAAVEVFGREFQYSLQIPKEENIEESRKFLNKFCGKLEKIKSRAKRGTAKLKVNALHSKFDPQVNVVKLKKGVTLIHRQNLMTPTFVLHAYLKGGLTEESDSDNGIYHLLGSVLCRGHGRESNDDIKKLLDDKSASMSGFSGKNAYGLTMHGQSEDIKILLHHFWGSLKNPSMLTREVTHEKQMVLRTLENMKEDPVKICFSRVNKLFFGEHPYAMNVLGTKKSLRGMTRKKLKDLHLKNLKNKEILICYCGDQSVDEIMSLLDSHLSVLKNREEKEIDYKDYFPQVGNKEFIPFDREQTQIFVGIPVSKLASRENLFLNILTTHLSGQSSELFMEVRDRRGLCYAVQPVHMIGLEGGYWGIYMASGHDKTEQAILAIEDILDGVAKDGLSKNEFNRVKKMIEGQNQINIQTNEDYAGIYSVPALQGFGVDFYYKNNEAIKKMTHENFQKNIKQLFSRKRNIVMVGRE